jgi:hypothetical protein
MLIKRKLRLIAGYYFASFVTDELLFYAEKKVKKKDI